MGWYRHGEVVWPQASNLFWGMETHAFGSGILDYENLCCCFGNYFNLLAPEFGI
jgi:hypothetical protein